MAETPKEVEINVVMGAQLRAIVRSALLHVRNKLTEMDVVPEPEDLTDLIDAELAKWPMSTIGEADHLAEWLEGRFGRAKEGAEYSEGYWEYQAASVRRAVGRGRYRPAEKPESERVRAMVLEGIGQIQQRHQAIGDLLQEYKNNGQPVVSVEQIFNILTGVANADQYTSALQVLPEGVER